MPENEASGKNSRKELIDVLKSEYQKEFDTARNTDSKASNMLATAGTVTGLLFGFGTFLVSNIKSDYELITFAMFFLLVAIGSNIVSVILSIFAFKMRRYQYVINPNYFFKDIGYDIKTRKGAENYDDEVGTFRADIALPTISYRMRYNLLTLAFSILMGVRMGGSENDFVEARIGIDKEDFNIILRDRKATHLLDETHDLFAERYKAFAKLKEMYDNT